MVPPSRRMARELRTVRAMIELYCRAHHGRRELCDECRALWTYAEQRVERCPFRADKPSCRKCPTHCYRAGLFLHGRMSTIRRCSFVDCGCAIGGSAWVVKAQVLFRDRRNKVQPFSLKGAESVLGRDTGIAVPVQGLGSQGRQQALAGALEQADVEVRFQVADLLRERRLRQTQAFCGTSDVAFLVQCDEIA